MRKTTGIMCGILTVLLLGLSPAVATAQSQVKGSGTNHYTSGAKDGSNYFQHVAVNAWLDDNGVANGMMTWQGDAYQPLPGGNIQYGPSDPYVMDVTDLFFVGNTAFVTGVVIASPEGNANGAVVQFSFTDNSGTGLADEIDFVPIDAGRIRVR